MCEPAATAFQRCDTCNRKWPGHSHTDDCTAPTFLLLRCPEKLLGAGRGATNDFCKNYVFISCLRFLCFRKICVPWQSNVITICLIMSFLESSFLLEPIFFGPWLDKRQSQKTGKWLFLSPAPWPLANQLTSPSSVYFSKNRCNRTCLLMLSFRLMR